MINAWRLVGTMWRTQPRLMTSRIIACAVIKLPTILAWAGMTSVATALRRAGSWGDLLFSVLEAGFLLPLLYASCGQTLGHSVQDRPFWLSAVWRQSRFLVIVIALTAGQMIVYRVCDALLSEPLQDRLNPLLSLAAYVVLQSGWIYVAMKLWLLVPAAVDGVRDLRVRHAFADTERRFWRIFLTWLLAALPVWLPYWLVLVIYLWRAPENGNVNIVLGSIWLLGELPLVIVAASIITGYYQLYGKWLRGY